MDELNRYVLGLALLEGDRTARGILADYLEEQSERGLAQWARKSGSGKRPRLEFGIMLLPCETSLEVAQAILMASARERGVDLSELTAYHLQWKSHRLQARLEDIGEQVAQAFLASWLQYISSPRPRNPEELSRREEQSLSWAGRNSLLQQAYVNAVLCATRFYLSLEENGDGKSMHWRVQANQHVRDVSTHLHHQVPESIDRHFQIVLDTYRRLAHAE